MGVQLDIEEEQSAEEVIEIMPENWDSLSAWLACQTQWRTIVAGTAVLMLGLDLPGVDVVLRRLEFPDTVFEDLLVMERAALPILQEAR